MSTIVDRDMHVSDPHEQFDYLCALDAAGQTSREERERLKEHLENCLECRQALSEYNDHVDLLTQFADSHATTSPPSGMYDRFRARAVEHGIRLPQDSVPSHTDSAKRPWITTVTSIALTPERAAIALLLLIVVFLVLTRSPILHRSSQAQKSTSPTAITPKSPSEIALEEKIRKLEAKQSDLTAELQRQEQTLREAESEKEATTSRMRNDAGEIADLKSRIASLEGDLSRQKRLAATSEEIQTLVGSRNVHIIVITAVKRENQLQAFARAFYIPEHILVFYAYDLADPNTSSVPSFYAWGVSGTNEPPQMLGKLALEGQEENRWVIRIYDPQVLAGIDEMFITKESDKDKVDKPTGQRMLITSLRSRSP